MCDLSSHMILKPTTIVVLTRPDRDSQTFCAHVPSNMKNFGVCIVQFALDLNLVYPLRFLRYPLEYAYPRLGTAGLDNNKDK